MKGYSIKSSDWEAIYPVGSIYMSANSTSPATLFGGTWTQLKDQFLLCAGSTYSAGSTGGTSTINLSHVHSTGNHTLTTGQIPSHIHETRFSWPDTHDSRYIGTANCIRGDGSGDCYTWVSDGYILDIGVENSAGGGQAHNHGNTGSNLSSSQSIMPPYLAVYVWKRTA